MKSLRLVKTAVCCAAMVFLTAAPAVSQSKEKGTAARLVAWQPKPGKDAELEEGYKRHLEWHRKNGDTWRWYGWDIISGERDGLFVDGTFFHAWADLDSPVSPAADGADNAGNVYPYGDVKSVATYETTAALTHMDHTALEAPFMTFYSFGVGPDLAVDFESAAATALAKLPAAVRCVLFRPATGTSEYLLLIASDKVSELGEQAAAARKFFSSLSRNLKANVVTSLRVETGRFRRDMSYLPEKSPK